jgi:hypothetical protein
VVKMLQNPDEARLMGQRGRAYVLEHCTYAVIADEVEKTLQRVLGEFS